MKKALPILIPAYFLLLLILAPVSLLSFDTYYYWDWSRHPDISYYDGSPMIAWFIRLATLFFGDTLFALSLVGIVTVGLSAFVFYKTLRLHLDKLSAYMALALWLFAPIVTMDLLKQTTYDTPMTLFWVLSIYFVTRYLKFNQNRDLYGIGIASGLLLLSKYSGVVLLLSFVIFLLTTQWRRLFINKHFYASLTLALIIFSPVLIWNYQHDWQSFTYQLSVHDLKDTEQNGSLFNMLKSFLYVFLPVLNMMLIPPLLMIFKKKDYPDSARPVIQLHLTICTVFLLFYLVIAANAEIREYWLAPYILSSAVLAGFCIEKMVLKKSAAAVVVLYAICSTVVMVNTTLWFHYTVPKKLVYYHLLRKFNEDHPQLPKTVVTAGWSEARMLFFLKNQPEIFTIGCGSLTNQYRIWSRDFHGKLARREIKEALYLDMYDRIYCVKKHFDRCERLKVDAGPYPEKPFKLYAYRCLND